MKNCKYVLAWIGKCGAECDGDFCKKHQGIKCSSCGGQATGECEDAGSLVCGSPLCDDCEGYQDLSNGRDKFRGFIGTGVHSHRKRNSNQSNTEEL